MSQTDGPNVEALNIGEPNGLLVSRTDGPIVEALNIIQPAFFSPHANRLFFMGTHLRYDNCSKHAADNKLQNIFRH